MFSKFFLCMSVCAGFLTIFAVLILVLQKKVSFSWCKVYSNSLCLCLENWISVTTADHSRPAKCLLGKFVSVFCFLTLFSTQKILCVVVVVVCRIKNEWFFFLPPRCRTKRISYALNFVQTDWFNQIDCYSNRFLFGRKAWMWQVLTSTWLYCRWLLIDSCVSVCLFVFFQSKNALENGPPSQFNRDENLFIGLLGRLLRFSVWW